MFGQPAQPATERTIVFVDRDDTGTRGAVEGAVGEDEAEGGQGFDQAAGLKLEDFGCDSAAVEAEDAWEGEVDGFWRCGGHSGYRCATSGWFG